jgi:hypothetical protein
MSVPAPTRRPVVQGGDRIGSAEVGVSEPDIGAYAHCLIEDVRAQVEMDGGGLHEAFGRALRGRNLCVWLHFRPSLLRLIPVPHCTDDH